MIKDRNCTEQNENNTRPRKKNWDNMVRRTEHTVNSNVRAIKWSLQLQNMN